MAWPAVLSCSKVDASIWMVLENYAAFTQCRSAMIGIFKYNANAGLRSFRFSMAEKAFSRVHLLMRLDLIYVLIPEWILHSHRVFWLAQEMFFWRVGSRQDL